MRVTVSRTAKVYLVSMIWLAAMFGTIVLAMQPLDSLYATFGVATLVRVALTMTLAIAVATAAAWFSWRLLERAESRLHTRHVAPSPARSADLVPASAGRTQR
jgi:hypothetical protein